MKLKELICKIVMFLCLLGLFEVGAGTKTYAEEWQTRDYKSYGDTITVRAKEQMIYKVLPDEDGLYEFQLICDTKKLIDGRTVYTAFATVYNSDKEFIASAHCDKNKEGQKVYLKSGKIYYFVVKKEVSCDSLNAKVCINKRWMGECEYPNVCEAYLNGEDYASITKANIKGVTYDKDTHILELNNYNGSDQFILNSFMTVLADEKDWSYLPKFNIKISGNNTVEYDKTAATLFTIYWCGNVNIIGDGTLNIKFNGKNKSVDDASLFLKTEKSSVVIDGPTINIEKAFGPVISTYGEEGPYGKLEIKSGSIVVSKFENEDEDYFYSVFETGYFKMSGGSIIVNYVRKNDVMPSHIYETIHSISDINITGGNIIVMGDEKVLAKLNPISSAGGVSDEEKNMVIKGNKLDVSKLDVELENTEYKYDGMAKEPKVTIYGLKEGKHFKVIYENNVKVGTAKVIVTGLGVFTGSKTVTFKITEGMDKNGSYDGYHGAKAGSKITDGIFTYKVTKEGTLDAKVTGEVTVTSLNKRLLKKVSIKSILTVNGVKYKVTAISKKALKNGKKLKSIVIGKSVSKISKGAFIGCKKLKSIIIKSKKIKKFAKGTFKSVKRTCVIKVPKAKKKSYAKKILKAGFKGIVK